MVDILSPIINPIYDAAVQPVSDAMDDVTGKVSAAVRDQINSSGIGKSFQAFIDGATETISNILATIMQFFEGLAHSAADWMGSERDNTLASLKESVLANADTLSSATSPDAAAMARLTATQLEGAENGFARFGKAAGSKASGALSALWSAVAPSSAHAADAGADTKTAAEAAEKHKAQALSVAKASREHYSQQTYNSLLDKALGSQVITDEQRASILENMKQNTLLQRYADAEATAWSGVNAKGEAAGDFGLRHAIVQSQNAAATLVVGRHNLKLEDALANTHQLIHF